MQGEYSTMSDSLSIYLQDHLAGAAYAIDLVAFMRDQHKGDELGQFAAALLDDIKADQDTLQQLADRAGAGSSTLKELTAWVSEKVSRLKLKHDAGDALGTFEALEFLALGIQGKLALWRTLGAVAMADDRLRGMNFERLAARAKKQHAEVENRRLQVAHTAFGSEAADKFGHTRNAGTSHAEPDRGRSSKTAVGSVFVALAVVVAISLAPDVVRYMKIRAM
jgi:hypothetical protein